MVTKSEINNQIIVINNTFTNNILLKGYKSDTVYAHFGMFPFSPLCPLKEI